MNIIHQTYGKADVRVLKVEREADSADTIYDLTVDVRLFGNFDAAYTNGDNTAVLPTDTMKNTVYVLARREPIGSPEAFAMRLTSHFMGRLPQIDKAIVSVKQRHWKNMVDGAAVMPHGFMGASGERRTAQVVHDREGTAVMGGFEGLPILKTADSGFSDFLKDELTTLQDTDDRILGTELSAEWTYTDGSTDHNAAHAAARHAMLIAFAKHSSLSVQHTLYAMAEAAFSAAPSLATVHLTMPNKHNLWVNLEPFDLDNPNVIFHPVDEPSGVIEAVISRA